MGVEYNQLGEECQSRKENKRLKIRMGGGQQLLHIEFLCMRRKGEQETELEDDVTMEGEF
jgi:hypothetical protein